MVGMMWFYNTNTMKKIIKDTVVRASLPGILAVPVAFAETADSNAGNSGDFLEPTVVFGDSFQGNQINAFKTGTPILDVPQSLSIYTDKQIKAQGIQSIGDIVDYTPGVHTSQGEGHRDAVVFRGVRSTADFFVDGVRDDVQYYRGLYNVEQVEILRGPNALFFGRGGTGGVLNRVMKKAQIGKRFGGYQLTLDTFGEATGQFDTNLPVNDQLALRLNFHYDYLMNHRDFYDGERFGINPTVTWKPGKDTTVRFSYEYADHERFIDRGIPVGSNGRPVSALADVVFGDSDLNYSTLEAHVLRFDLEHEFSKNWKGNLTVSYGDYDKFYQNFYASGYNQATDVVTLDGYVDTTERRNFTLSGNVVGEFETGNVKHKLVIGAEYTDVSSDQDRYNAFWDTTSDDNENFIASNFRLRGGVGVNSSGVVTTNSFNTDLNDDTRVDLETYSFYLHDEIALSNQLDLVLGARFDSFDIRVFNAANGETRSRKDEEVSPRVGLVYKPVENVSFYGSYSMSFLPRSGEQYANINGDNDRLDPNEFTNLEAGVKWDITNSLNFTASVFEIEQKSQVVSDVDSSLFDTIESDIKGFELQLQGRVTDWWYVSAGYGYLDGEQANGNRLRELPRHKFSLWNQFKLDDKCGFGLGLVYQDESYTNNSNTSELPSYIRVDASAYYDISDDVRIQLNIENLFDRDYYPNAHSTHQVTVGAPINARIGIIGKF